MKAVAFEVDANLEVVSFSRNQCESFVTQTPI